MICFVFQSLDDVPEEITNLISAALDPPVGYENSLGSEQTELFTFRPSHVGQPATNGKEAPMPYTPKYEKKCFE